MKRIFLSVIFLSVLFLVSCTDSFSGEFTWQGTWYSETNYDERGTFIFNFNIEHEELTGTITIPGLGISDLQIEGEITRNTILMVEVSNIEFYDIDGMMSFTATIYSHDIDSDTRAYGYYIDIEEADMGRWYCTDDSRKDFSNVSSFPLSSSIFYPCGLCFDGNHLWLTDAAASSIIYKIDPTDGTVVDSFDVSADISYPEGLAWDGTSLWCASTDGLYRLDTLCSVNLSITFDAYSGDDITYASGHIWCGDLYELLKVDPWTGYVEDSYNFDAALPQGFAFDGTHLWVSEIGTYEGWPAIFKVNQSGSIRETYNAPCFSAGGLAFGDSCLYCIDDAYNRIFKLEF
jgi:hypothetical protein